MMNSQEMETAVRLKLNLVVIVLNDGSYGMIRWKQAGGGHPDWGLEFGNPNFVDYAKSYGANGHRISSAEELTSTLEAAYKTGGVHLVEIPVDYSDNKQLLIDDLRKNHRAH
jgi:acetolactate synthase-1/2/3 large subunit